jgi:YD repeat-containing protein
MVEVSSSRLIAGVAALIVLAVMWDVFTSRHGEPAGAAPANPPAAAPADSALRASGGAPAANRASQGTSRPDSGGQSEPGYMEQLARSETRRRIRSSGETTYLNEIVAESQDSSLHRWDNRGLNPVRVYLGPGTVANYRPEFLDAIRTAFQQWQQTGVPVTFDLTADTSRAEVVFRWKIQFEIDRTGQTDLEWDQDGRITRATVTIASFDPKGRPLEPDDIRAIALHEIGHVLGLDHSPDSTDLMYARGTVRQISDRDVRTAILLYQLSSGSLR